MFPTAGSLGMSCLHSLPYGAGQDLLPVLSWADMHPLLGVVRENDVLTIYRVKRR